MVSLVEERECLRVEGRGRSSRAKREPEGAPTAGEGAPKGGREKGKIKLSERAKPSKITHRANRDGRCLN